MFIFLMLILFFCCSQHRSTTIKERNEVLNSCKISVQEMPKSLLTDLFDVWNPKVVDFQPNQNITTNFSPLQLRRIGSYVMYNPSIVYLNQSKYIFAGRFTWQDNPECAGIHGAKELYYCMRTFKSRDQSIIGLFDEKLCVATIESQTLLADGRTTTALGSITGWFQGAGWFDTKLLLPTDVAALQSSPGKAGAAVLQAVLLTSQRSERISAEAIASKLPLHDWAAGGNTLTQMLYMAARQSGTGAVTFSRAIYYDDGPFDWATKFSFVKLGGRKVSTLFLIHMLCDPDTTRRYPHPRQVSLTSAPVSIGTRDRGFWTGLFGGGRADKKAAAAGPGRRLDSFASEIKDKNWSPFSYNGTLLWSYHINPHIVCQLDKDIYQISREAAASASASNRSSDFFDECAICRRRFASDHSALFENYTALMLQRVTSELLTRPNLTILNKYANYHLNGLPAYRMRRKEHYVGIAHLVLGIYYEDSTFKADYYERQYIHFLYKMESRPPFRVLKLSRPLPMETDRSVASWFNPNEIGGIAFASGFSFDSSAAGREFAISYGVGDHLSKVLRLGLRNVNRLFQP